MGGGRPRKLWPQPVCRAHLECERVQPHRMHCLVTSPSYHSPALLILTHPFHSCPGKGICTPSFSSYLYFLFCPTLIYRETYPR